MKKKVKLLVEIDENDYERLVRFPSTYASPYCQAIRNGTPITDDCISREWVLNQLDTTELCLTDDWETARHIVEDAPTIGGKDNDK